MATGNLQGPILPHRRVAASLAALFGLTASTAMAASETLFTESFTDGNAALARWEYKGESTPSIAPSPWAPARSVFTLDFRVSRTWRMVSRQELSLAAGGQYTIAAKLCARGPWSTIAVSVERLTGGPIASATCADTKEKSKEVSLIFWAPPEATAARVAVTGSGCGGEVWLEEVKLTHHDPPLSTYPTGTCTRRPLRHEPFTWVGNMIEAEKAQTDPAAITDADSNSDGRWALYRVSRDENSLMFMEGTVLKSDSASEEEGGHTPPLHLAANGFLPGKYHAYLNDPFRDTAISLDGKEWKRVVGGKGEIDIGEVTVAAAGRFEFWAAHRFKTAGNPGPIYIDYVRLVPVYDPANPPERPTPVPPALAPVDRREVTLTVRGGSDLPRLGEWVVTGIPVPSGELPDGTRVTMEGAPSLYAKPLVRWPDGSAKWVRLLFRADCPDGKPKAYRLSYGASVTPPAPLTSHNARTAADGTTTLAFGSIEVVVKTGLWDQIRYKGQALLDGTPQVQFACKPDVVLNELRVEKVSVEGEDGPCPAVLVDGHLAKGGTPGPIAFRARLRERTPSVLGLAFSILNEAKGEPKPGRTNACGFLQMTACSLSLPGIRLSPNEIVWPGRSVAASARQTLLQAGEGPSVRTFKGNWTLTSDNAVVAKGERTAGWVDLREKTRGLTIGVREFSEKYPKSLSLLRDGDTWSARVGIWPDSAPEPFWFGQGTQITTELALVFHDGIGPEARAGALAAVEDPLRATLAPEDYCRASVFWEVAPAATSRWPAYETCVDKAFEGINQDCTSYGVEDWGDAFVPGGPYVRGMTKLWINNEHEFCGALLSQFVRTGNLSYLTRADQLARHFVSADIIRRHERKNWIGGAYQHSPGMEIGHQVDTPRFSHAGWPQGILWTYYLTGDESLREGVCGLADYVVTNLPDMSLKLMREERDCAYPLITLCSIYDLTRDPRHLAAADRIVDYVLRCQDQKSGGWTSPASYTPYRGSSSAFINFLSRGLGYYAELTGDTRVANSLAMAGRWAIDDRKSPLGYAEVVAVSTSHSDQWGRLSQAARKDLDASFGGKEVPASSVGGANPRELAHAIIRYNRLMGAVQKAQ